MTHAPIRPIQRRPNARIHAASIAVATLAAVIACAGPQTVVVWEKPGAGPDEVEAARRVCLAELGPPEAEGVNRMRLEAEATGRCFVECMRRQGFTWRTERRSASGEVIEAGPPVYELEGASDSAGCPSNGTGGDGS